MYIYAYIYNVCVCVCVCIVYLRQEEAQRGLEEQLAQHMREAAVEAEKMRAQAIYIYICMYVCM